MKSVRWLLAILTLLCAMLAEAQDPKPASSHVALDAAEIQWRQAPAALNKGVEVAVLSGNPGAAGPFVMRMKMPAGYKIAPHWHTKDEQLTVISGTFTLYMGDTMKDPHELTAGAFHFLPGKAHHAAVAKGEAIVQINGVGPFDIHYINPADDPRRK